MRCVEELGFVGCNLNPDTSGGFFNGPGLADRYWYPLYEKMCELGVPAMIHVSEACNTPYFQTTGSYYLAADTVAFMQMMTSDLFKDFPDLKLIIPHGGGAVPYHWGRFRGLADMLKRPPLKESVLNNVYFDTCVYHQPGIDLLLDVIPIDNILFASEMVGAVRGIDPETGHYFDDTKRYIDGSKKLTRRRSSARSSKATSAASSSASPRRSDAEPGVEYERCAPSARGELDGQFDPDARAVALLGCLLLTAAQTQECARGTIAPWSQEQQRAATWRGRAPASRNANAALPWTGREPIRLGSRGVPARRRTGTRPPLPSS